MFRSYRAIVMFFIVSFAPCLGSETVASNLNNLNETKLNLINEINTLKERLEKHNCAKIYSYTKFCFFFFASALVYYLPFAPDSFVVERDDLYVYVLAVLFTNSVLQRSFINAFELPKTLRKKIESKNKQLEILNELISCKTTTEQLR